MDRGTGQRGQLGLDVDRLLAAPQAPRVARLEHLPDLGLLLGGAGPRVGGAGQGIGLDAAGPDLLVGAPGAGEGGHADHGPQADNDEDHDHQRLFHRSYRPIRLPGALGVQLTD